MTSPDNGHNPRTDDRSVLSVIRDIQQGAIEAKSLAVEARRRCVEHLTGDGYSIAQTAEIFKVDERTIARDRAAIRQANSIESYPQMTGQMVGQLINQADTCLQRIRRVTRERDTPPNVRIDGEKTCWMIFHNLIQRLQSLGYLPTAPQQLQAELKHQIESLPGFGELTDEVARLELIVGTHEVSEEKQPLLQELTDLKDKVARGSLSEQITAMKERLLGNGQTGDEQGT